MYVVIYILLLFKFFKVFRKTVYTVTKLPDEFYVFWNTEKKILLIKSKGFLNNIINDIDEIIFCKNNKLTKESNRGIKGRYFTSRPNVDYDSLFDSNGIDKKDYNGLNSNNNVNAFQQYENYSLKSQCLIEGDDVSEFDKQTKEKRNSDPNDDDEEENEDDKEKYSFEKQEIKEGHNILYMQYLNPNDSITNNDISYVKKDISFITVDLFISLLQDNPHIFDLPESNNTNDVDSHNGLISVFNENDIITGFVTQYTAFISTKILIHKITNAIEYYMCVNINNPPYHLVYFLLTVIIKNFKKEIQHNTKVKTHLTTFLRYLLSHEHLYLDSKTKDLITDVVFLLESYDDIEITSMLTQITRNKKRQSTRHKSSIHFKNAFMFPESLIINPLQNKLVEWDAIDIAKELTYITSTMVIQIEESELLFHNFNSVHKKIKAPNICNLIERFDKLSFFIMEEILSYDKKKYRAKVIEKFIHVADELRKMHNFNDCMNIKSCLNHFILRTLDKTWKIVDKESIDILNALNKNFSFERNFSLLRNEIETCKSMGTSYIPYFGLVLKDIAFNEEGMKYLHKENKQLFNLNKVVKVQKILKSFFMFKKHAALLCGKHIYGLEILNEINPKKEEELEEIKNMLEPMFTLAKKKIALKRMTKTDITLMNQNKNCFLSFSAKKRSFDTEDTGGFGEDEDDGYEGDGDCKKGNFNNRNINKGDKGKDDKVIENASGNNEEKVFVVRGGRKETK